MMRTHFTTAVILLMLLPGAAAAGDWPCLQGPDQSGISHEEGLARQWPATGPPVRWARSLGQGFSGPAVRDRRVFVLDRVDDEKDVLRCLDLDSGEQLWESANDAPGRLSYNGSRGVPTVGPQRVYAVGPFGHVYCFDRKAKRRLWHVELMKAFPRDPPQFGYAQSPLPYKGSVIVCPATDTVGLVALDQVSGEVRWRSPPVGTKGYVSPILYRHGAIDGVLFVTKQQVSCIDAKTGTLLWNYTGYHPLQPVAPPTIVNGGRLFVTAADDAGSVMLNVLQQGKRWRVTELFKLTDYGSQLHPPVCYEGYLYGKFFTYEPGEQGQRNLVSRMICFDLEGRIQWKTNDRPWVERGNLIIADGMIFTLNGQTGELTLADARPGGYKQLARARVLQGDGSFVISPMALSEGNLLVRDQHEIKCLDILSE